MTKARLKGRLWIRSRDSFCRLCVLIAEQSAGNPSVTRERNHGKCVIMPDQSTLHFKTFCIFFHEALCFWNETEVLSITMWKGNLSLNDTLGSLKRVPYGAPISRTDAFFHQHNNNNNTAAACYTEWSITFIWMSLWNAINGEFLIVATSKDKRVLSSSSSAQISTLFFPSLKQ